MLILCCYCFDLNLLAWCGDWWVVVLSIEGWRKKSAACLINRLPSLLAIRLLRHVLNFIHFQRRLFLVCIERGNSAPGAHKTYLCLKIRNTHNGSSRRQSEQAAFKLINSERRSKTLIWWCGCVLPPITSLLTSSNGMLSFGASSSTNVRWSSEKSCSYVEGRPHQTREWSNAAGSLGGGKFWYRTEWTWRRWTGLKARG